MKGGWEGAYYCDRFAVGAGIHDPHTSLVGDSPNALHTYILYFYINISMFSCTQTQINMRLDTSFRELLCSVNFLCFSRAKLHSHQTKGLPLPPKYVWLPQRRKMQWIFYNACNMQCGYYPLDKHNAAISGEQYSNN